MRVGSASFALSSSEARQSFEHVVDEDLERGLVPFSRPRSALAKIDNRGSCAVPGVCNARSCHARVCADVRCFKIFYKK